MLGLRVPFGLGQTTFESTERIDDIDVHVRKVQQGPKESLFLIFPVRAHRPASHLCEKIGQRVTIKFGTEHVVRGVVVVDAVGVRSKRTSKHAPQNSIAYRLAHVAHLLRILVAKNAYGEQPERVTGRRVLPRGSQFNRRTGNVECVGRGYSYASQQQQKAKLVVADLRRNVGGDVEKWQQAIQRVFLHKSETEDRVDQLSIYLVTAANTHIVCVVCVVCVVCFVILVRFRVRFRVTPTIVRRS